jgi:hypothetical protein
MGLFKFDKQQQQQQQRSVNKDYETTEVVNVTPDVSVLKINASSLRNEHEKSMFGSDIISDQVKTFSSSSSSPSLALSSHNNYNNDNGNEFVKRWKERRNERKKAVLKNMSKPSPFQSSNWYLLVLEILGTASAIEKVYLKEAIDGILKPKSAPLLNPSHVVTIAEAITREETKAQVPNEVNQKIEYALHNNNIDLPSTGAEKNDYKILVAVMGKLKTLSKITTTATKKIVKKKKIAKAKANLALKPKPKINKSKHKKNKK